MALGRGELIDASAQPGFVAKIDGELAGVITYAERDGTVEIITIDAVVPGKGVGKVLPALRLRPGGPAPERRRPGAGVLWSRPLRPPLAPASLSPAELLRSIKPDIPAEADGIPIKREPELELTL
ncbi:hypothetical protein ETD86_09815 [Nonomuraea turkmeniaca]|uniref:Uncharacterized protein n=1 Tax=Nonomuraea turkmeniaca TaxID=103838 RepID=A0A5S4FQQ3_9ACTN|nr:hypothetical protein [Nonomuraea turkmeniaca]TMR23022.1 hypothetical protein ETD86_09815 [Nonomuraea turkmeniaca]